MQANGAMCMPRRTSVPHNVLGITHTVILHTVTLRLGGHTSSPRKSACTSAVNGGTVRRVRRGRAGRGPFLHKATIWCQGAAGRKLPHTPTATPL